MNTYKIFGKTYDEETLEAYRFSRQTVNRKKILKEYFKIKKARLEEDADKYDPYRNNRSVTNDGNDITGVKIDDLSNVKSIRVDDFINSFYRIYWEYSNRGKNAINVNDGISEAVRKVTFAAYKLNLKEGKEITGSTIKGETRKYHAHGDDSIEETIKGMASPYKNQPETSLLLGIGNFGTAPGSSGAALRYSSVAGTPLLTAIFKDMKYAPKNADDTGVEQPDYIPTPYPIDIINSSDMIGTGASNFIAERPAKEALDWAEDVIRGKKTKVPDAISDTGCDTEFNETNGYIYYYAKVHYNVDRDDLNKRGKYDVITAFPPNISADAFILNWHNRYKGTKWEDVVVNGKGDNKPTWVILPHGLIAKDHTNWSREKLQVAKKEKVLIWDDDQHTMYEGKLEDLVHGWYKARKEMVTKRLKDEIAKLNDSNHVINLIKLFAENHMMDWSEDKVINFYTNLANENGLYDNGVDKPLSAEEQGKSDANAVLSMTARSFLPENVDNNELKRKSNLEDIKKLQDNITNIMDFIFKEAHEVMETQRKFIVERRNM